MPREERSYRTPGIILKRRGFGEADRLLTVITPDHGKIDLIAKGARKPTSTKTGHVELFTRADILVHRGRNLDIAAQVEMVEAYLPLREDLQRGAYASYTAELLDHFTTLGDENLSSLFNLLADTLQRLCEEDDLRLVVRYYELHLLDLVGFRPELNLCVFTHEAIQPEDQFFSYAEGGVVSPRAAQHSDSLIALALRTLKLLRHMQRSPYSHVGSLRVTQQLHNDVERLMLGYITYLLERRLQSVDFIRRIRV
jgi:DNA repair protein RecO (recombination protein O)